MGAGHPDFGLYAAERFQKTDDPDPMPGQMPARSVVEVKGWNDDAFATARSEQVSGYWKKYGQVLVTNFREFVLVGRDKEGRPAEFDRFRLAGGGAEFEGMLRHPRKTAKAEGDRMVDFLSRVFLHQAPLRDPRDVAWFLASYDPELRKELGVWYTPPEIVKYQVERVDRMLREELGIPDGLADPKVYVLDQCRGTGAYLVETLRRIHATPMEQGGDALVALMRKYCNPKVEWEDLAREETGLTRDAARFATCHVALRATADREVRPSPGVATTERWRIPGDVFSVQSLVSIRGFRLDAGTSRKRVTVPDLLPILPPLRPKLPRRGSGVRWREALRPGRG